MDKYCLIYQPCGLGDIFFIQKICKFWSEKGYKIILPVIHEYYWLNDYITDVNFISWDDKVRKLTHLDPLPDHVNFPYKERYNPHHDSYFSDDFVFINLFKSSGGLIMKSKYSDLGIDYTDWSNYFTFKRNTKKENDLYDLLGLNEGDEYIFINRNYMMRPSVVPYTKISNSPSDYNNLKLIELSIMDGFTIFDWLKVIENAKEIHMIETSLNYILETKQVKLKTDKLNLYSRINNFVEVDYLFKLNWNYIV